MIGYLSGQGGDILNKFFIDQACSVKMAGYWPHSFLRVYGHAKKELGQYPAILTSYIYFIYISLHLVFLYESQVNFS